MTARICVIDDDPEVRGSLGSLLRSTGLDVALFETPEAFLAAGVPEVPSCLILDVRLQGADGLDFQQKLADDGIFIPIILITGHGDIPMTVRGMKAGAVDFLPKPFQESDMLAAVNAAIQRDTLRRLGDREAAGLRAQYEELTPREREVMALVAAGLMNKQVAGRIGAFGNHGQDSPGQCDAQDGGAIARRPGAHGGTSACARRRRQTLQYLRRLTPKYDGESGPSSAISREGAGGPVGE